jgi:trigger factor
MSVKNCEKLEKNQVALTVEVDAAAFDAAIEKAYRKVRHQINVPGFRKGKAPRKMIENLYGVEIFYDEAINIAMPDAYVAAVSEEKLEPVGYPEVELLSVSKDGFSFKATVYVYPEVTLGQYKGLSAPKGEVKVTEEDIQERLNQLAERNTRMLGVDRPVENGDVANIDFEGFLDNKPFDGGKGENFDLEIGSGSFVPGFEEQLTGMAAGEEKDIDITFPEDYHAELAGKAVVFHVKVNAVKRKEVPTLDDEFAKDVSEFDTLEELKKDIESKIAADRQSAVDHAFEEALMEQVAEGIQCDVPQPMVDEQARRFVENLKMQIQQQGIPYEQYLKLAGLDDESVMAQAQTPALRQVRLDLALEALAKAEGLEVSYEEIEAEYERAAGQYGMKAEDLKKYIDQGTIKNQLVNTKAVKVVVDSAIATKFEEKAPEGEEPVEGEEKPKKRTSKKAAESAEPAEGEEKPKKRASKKAAESAEPAEGEEKPKKRASKKAAPKDEEKPEA